MTNREPTTTVTDYTLTSDTHPGRRAPAAPTIERLGDEAKRDGHILETLGEVPCSTPGCEGTGYQQRIIDRVLTMPCPSCAAAAEQQQAEEERAHQASLLLDRAGGTPRLLEFSLDSYPDDPRHAEVKKVVLGWRDVVLESPRRAPNLLLYGPVGGGKTGLMWPVVVSFCEHLVSARLVDFPALLDQMREAYAKKVPFDKFSDLGKVPVLVLDDIGAEKPTEWARAQLLSLVNTRYERLLPTAYISNYKPNKLVERLGQDDLVIGERIVSRMMENATQKHVDSPDLRAS